MSEIEDSEIEFAARLEDDLRQFWQRISKDDKFYGEYKRPQPPVITESETTLASVRRKRAEEDEPSDERRLGACCDGSGNCTQEYMHTCAGTFLGELIPCDPNPCGAATGACCASDGTCSILSSADCASAGGTYQGDGTGCSPNPCPQPTGACCHSDGTCSIETATDCTDLVGGTYQGDDTVCDPNPCPPGCPLINLTCDSISASLSKCGYFNSTDGKYYLDEYITTTMTRDSPEGSTCFDEPGHTLRNCSWREVGSCSQKNHYSKTLNLDGSCSVESFVGCENLGGSFAYPPVSMGGCCSQFTCVGTSYSWDACATCQSGFSCPPGTSPCCVFFDGGSSSTTYATEYTTAELITHTENNLPVYSGTYTGGACAASRFLSSDEHTYSIQRSKPKFEFTPAPSNLTICYNEHFVPANGDPPSDVVRTLGITTGQTEAFGPEILEPSTNGTTTVENVACALEGMTCTP